MKKWDTNITSENITNLGYSFKNTISFELIAIDLTIIDKTQPSIVSLMNIRRTNITNNTSSGSEA